MYDLIEAYHWAILCLGLTGAMSLIQLLAFDMMAIKLKHPPGYPIESSHKNLLFRLSRAHANTNETLGTMIALFLFTLLTQADPYWVNTLMSGYFSARVLHMVFYYTASSTLRSVAFGLSILALICLFVVGMMTYF